MIDYQQMLSDLHVRKSHSSLSNAISPEALNVYSFSAGLWRRTQNTASACWDRLDDLAAFAAAKPAFAAFAAASAFVLARVGADGAIAAQSR